MSQLVTQEPPAVSLWPRRLRRWSLRLLPAALLAGAYCYCFSVANRSLEQAVATIDRTDPRWRLEELEAVRPAIPGEKNSALCVLAAERLLPKNWATRNYNPWSSNSPPEQLHDALRIQLFDHLAKIQPARAEARRLADMPDGRYPLPPSSNDFSFTALSYSEAARRIAELLRLDALLSAQEDKLDQALASCRAAFNAGRSLDDEQLPHDADGRRLLVHGALQTAERVLAQGEPSEPCLAAWQRLLQIEEARPAVLIYLRAERAYWHAQLTAAVSGAPQTIAAPGIFPAKSQRIPPGAGVLRALAVPHVKHVHAEVLRYLTGYVEAARLPAEQPEAALAEWARTAELPSFGFGLNFLQINPMPTVFACRQAKAERRCALAAAAVERFRQDRGHWPATLAELCPTYLADIPADPFGGPLRYRRLADGVIVYSVGPDGRDDGGKLNRNSPGAMGTDIGFQLWDVAKRRQPPLPLALPPPSTPVGPWFPKPPFPIGPRLPTPP